MTLLEAVTSVASEAGYTVDTAVSSSTDQTTVQLLAIAQRVIAKMGKAYPWSKLYASGSVTLAAGTASYALPAAFSYYHYETFWNSSNRWCVIGPMTEQRYAEIRGFGLTPGIYSEFQLRGIADNRLLISPTPDTNGEVLIFEYMTNRYVRPQTWLVGTTFAANAYCFYNGNYYQTTAGGSGGSAPVHTTGTTGLWTFYDGPYESFLADTDVPIFSQSILEQGMLERFGEIHGLDSITRSFDSELNEEFSRDIPGKVLYVSGTDNSQMMFARSSRAVFGNWI